MEPISRRELIARATAAAGLAVSGRAFAADANGGQPVAGPADQEHIAGRVISLAGAWRFLRNGPKPDSKPGELPSLTFADTISLPGTTDTNRKGPANDYVDADGPTWPYGFVGPCWYEQDIQIPDAWQGKRVSLLMERTRYTQVWLDGKAVGDNAILCTPQIYTLGTGISVGAHKLTVVVDNSRKPANPADTHMWSGNTQGDWNGIIGKIQLIATDAVWLDDIQIYPDIAKRSITVKARIGSISQADGAGVVTIQVAGEGIASGLTKKSQVTWTGATSEVAIPVELGPQAALWDEFHPAVHNCTVRLTGEGIVDERYITFGLREFKPLDKQFAINGRTIFLRGKHDACVFPLTGFAPMETDGWIKYFTILKSYGLNHVRFHTWTPPESAFDAADRMGFYLQPELPYWGGWTEDVRAAMEPEAKQILTHIGNHPSFALFSMGNEPWAGQDVISEMLADLHALDNRRLFVHGTGDGRPIAGDDYTIGGSVRPDYNHPPMSIRGSNGGDPSTDGHVQVGPPNTMTDYSASIAPMPDPVISHEVGQYTIYPDFAQIAKYTGACVPHNLERLEKILSDSGMGAHAGAFADSTGALAALCYREDIEACLRTPKHAGFDLLDMVDYLGQGTALVGILDAFMDSKGAITPEEWRQFCAPIVLLARFEKYTWMADEVFAASVEIAHYGDRDIPATELDWTLSDSTGKKVSSGRLPVAACPRGGLTQVAQLSIGLDGVPVPSQLKLELSLEGAPVKTSYPLWVYPATAETTPPAGVTLARAFDADARAKLAAGGLVVLVCDSRPLARTVGGGSFATDFWNFRFFYNKPGTMGILCDPTSAAVAAFPTESHSNWQWFDVAFNAQPLVLDDVVPASYTPTVQVVDNYERCHKLGLVFEATVGPGRLLVCACDLVTLSTTSVSARQLLASLLAYAGSNQFNPQTEISEASLRHLLRAIVPMAGCKASASSTEDSWHNYSASQLIDGNDSRGWHAAPNAAGDTWCQVEFPSPLTLTGVELLWDIDAPGYKYTVLGSNDGTAWQTLSYQTTNTFKLARQEVPFAAATVRFVRIAIAAVPYTDHAPVVMEIRFFAPEEA